ncbi:MAG TPA: hypothetical protein PLL77_08605 [Pyrinomonadaceae bacterium]|nr:hypothetical protein [Pyrinomonadaceae bacterium]
MLFYALIGISLVLVGITGLQFTYMFYLDRLHVERKKYLRELEAKNAKLNAELADAKNRIDMFEAAYPEIRKDEEVWAEVLDEA